MQSILPLAAGLALVLRSARALFSGSLKTCQGGNYTTSLGHLFQCCTALAAQQFVLLLSLKLLS